MTFYERLAIAMEQKGVTAYRTAQETGINQANFTRWASGENEPSSKALRKLSDYLGVSTDYLLHGDQISRPNEIARILKIPVLGVVPCGVPIEAIEDIIEYIDVVPSMAREHFGLIAKGDSMHPFICSGDILIVKKTPDVQSGKIAIVKVNGDEATCKKLIVHTSGVSLVPLNTNYEPAFYSAQEVESLPVTVIGEVVEIRRRFR